MGVSLTHPALASFLSWEFLLHIPCLLYFSLGRFSYTSHAAFSSSSSSFFFFWGVSLTHPVLASLFVWGVSLTPPALALFFYLGSFSDTPMLALFFYGEFLLHVPFSLFFFYLASFSSTSRGGFIFIWGVSVTKNHVGNFSYTFCAGCIMWGVSLTCPILASRWDFLHIPCWLLDVGSFSYMFPGGWWLLYVGIFSYDTNCLWIFFFFFFLWKRK